MRDLNQNYGLRGIALRGFGTQEDFEASKQAGFAAHLIKLAISPSISRAPRSNREARRFIIDRNRADRTCKGADYLASVEVAVTCGKWKSVSRCLASIVPKKRAATSAGA